MTLNLAVQLEESAKEKPEKPALILGKHELTYAELRDAAKKFANALTGLGVEPGDKVALMLPNVPQFAVVYYGITQRGRYRRSPERAPQRHRGCLPPG